jgi:FkbM family methyltransferase
VKLAVFDKLSTVISKSKLLCALGRRSIQIRVNDSNVDIQKNGEQSLMRVILPLLDKESLVIDIGCNVGTWSIMIARSGYKGNVLMIDMDVDSTNQAHANMSQYLDMSTEILTRMVSSEKGSVANYYKGVTSSHNSVHDMRVIGDREDKIIESSERISLESLCEERAYSRVDFLKIDVEGNELEVLLGAKSLLENQEIDVIQFEYGDAAQAARVFLTDIVHFFHLYNYSVYKIMPNCLVRIEIEPAINRSYSCSNFVALSEKRISDLDTYISLNYV